MKAARQIYPPNPRAPVYGTTGDFSGSVSAGTTFNIGDNPILTGLMLKNAFWEKLGFDRFSIETKTGSGTSAINLGHRMYVNSGTTGASYCARSMTAGCQGLSIGSLYTIINWSLPFGLSVTLSRSDTTTNGKMWVCIGTNPTAVPTNADPATKSIGIRVDADVLKGVCHNGTDLDVVDLSTTLAVNQVYKIDVISDGAGNVAWYADGVLAGASTGGPTGNGSVNCNDVVFWTTNGPDAAVQILYVYVIKIISGEI